MSKQLSDKHNKYLVAGVVMLSLGIGTKGLCRTARAITRVLNLWSVLLDVGYITAVSRVIEVILDRLGRVKIPVLRRFTIAIAVLFGVIQGAAKEIAFFADDVATVREFGADVTKMCDALKAAGDMGLDFLGDLSSDFEDVIDNVPRDIKERFEDAVDRLKDAADEIS